MVHQENKNYYEIEFFSVGQSYVLRHNLLSLLSSENIPIPLRVGQIWGILVPISPHPIHLGHTIHAQDVKRNIASSFTRWASFRLEVYEYGSGRAFYYSDTVAVWTSCHFHL